MNLLFVGNSNLEYGSIDTKLKHDCIKFIINERTNRLEQLFTKAEKTLTYVNQIYKNEQTKKRQKKQEIVLHFISSEKKDFINIWWFNFWLASISEPRFCEHEKKTHTNKKWKQLPPTHKFQIDYHVVPFLLMFFWPIMLNVHR